MVDYTKKASSITPMSTGELGSSLLAAKGAREEILLLFVVFKEM